MTIKTVIFDFDGTIIDTETIWYHVFKEVLLERYDMELPLEEFAKVIGTTDESLQQYIQMQTGAEVDWQEIRRLTHEQFSGRLATLAVREGVKEKLDEAKQLGFQLGLASSSDRKWVEGFLKDFALWDYFSVVKTKEDVKKVKPDPALYVKALEELRVEPEEAVAIEDSVNGSIAAINAGMKCIVIPNEVTSFLTFPEKTYRVESFGDFSFEMFK